MILRSIIIDDEKKGISALKQLMELYVPEVKVIAECMRPADAIKLIEDYQPDILFLDIDMPKMNGFEMLEKLSWKKFNLVFTTAHQEYGLKALKNNAIDYLLKPISPDDLALTVERIKQKIAENSVTVRFNPNDLRQLYNQSSKPRILINSVSGSEYIDPDEVIYLEAKSNYTSIKLTGPQQIMTRKLLKDFESQLCNTELKFMRIHHSFIINLDKVIKYLKVSEEIVLSEDIKIPLAKAKRESFFKWMNI